MSLDTFDGLKQEIIDWSHRGDLADRTNVFIELAETQMLSNPLQPLRLRGNEVLAPFVTSITDRFVSLPAGYQSMRKIRIQIVNGQSHEIRFMTPTSLRVRDHAGLPDFFTITSQIELDRISDIVYSGEIQYIQGFTPLADNIQTNNVLDNHPDIYLFGALAALFTHAQDTEQSGIYYNQFLQAIKAANDADEFGRYGPAPTMRVEGSIP